ncbi:hypothetical protein F4859DRAFT_522277 [Xylaria cf. heliscus]|nr:hypothetical protein F4859DRAFT_522277 [Xylaria cf. heliscus]
MSARSPIGKPIVGRPRRSRTIGSAEYQTPVKTTRGQHSRHRSAYDKDDVGLAPEVPRIPGRFLPRNVNRDSGSEQEFLQNMAGKEVDLKSTPAPHTRYLPNCSFGKPKEVQVISNAMMQAYVSMRGNSMGGQSENDPLFEWIQQREELAQASKPKIHQKRDVSRMLELIDKALQSSNMGGDSPRDCVFEVYRPNFDHIKPPQDMDMSANVFTACCSDFEWTEDSDDEEAHVPSGRISPCTFLEWSKNCVRWNADKNKNKENTSSYRRMRPPTPKIPVPSTRHEHSNCGYLEPQWDVNTGEELTPTYYVPSSPSIIYTPPGVEFAGFRNVNFHQQYKRMAPLAERELRTKLYGCEGVPFQLSDDEDDRFSTSEVDAATATVPELHGRRGAEIEAAFRDQWAAIRRAEEAEKELYQHAEQQRQHLARLQYDEQHLREFLPALEVRREMRDARAREAVEAQMRRGARIRAYVAEHALEAQSRLDTAWHRLHCTQARVSENMLRIAGLENEVRDLCFRGGVRDPQHAYAVLMGVESDAGDDDVPVSVQVPAPGPAHAHTHAGVNVGVTVNGYGGCGHGYAYGAGGNVNGGPLGPWSASSLGRAEEEYDRFLADMQMQNMGRAKIREWEKFYDDDESRDSGVAGVGGGDQYCFHHQTPDVMGYRG